MSLPAEETIINPTIDFKGFSLNVNKSEAIFSPGSDRSLSEEAFLKATAEDGVIILDARSATDYGKLHIVGAVNLPFTDFTEASLAGVIPSKSTKVLIYCNNNFRGAATMTKVASAALNLHSAVALQSYGYTNVFQLSPLIDIRKTKIPFKGTALVAPSELSNSFNR